MKMNEIFRDNSIRKYSQQIDPQIVINFVNFIANIMTDYFLRSNSFTDYLLLEMLIHV